MAPSPPARSRTGTHLVRLALLAFAVTRASSLETSPDDLARLECDSDSASALTVYVYDLHQKFNWGLFRGEALDALPHSPAGPVEQHYKRRADGSAVGKYFEHSAESFLAYDLLYPPEVNSSTTIGNEVVRVEDPAEADVFFVPFLSSLSVNIFTREGMHTALSEKDRGLQEELMQRSGGHDHVVLMVHPNALRFVRDRIPSPIFLVADFARAPQGTSRLSKDIVVPYNHMLPTFHESASDAEASWARRTTLLYFQGTVKRKNEGYIRKLLYDMLKDNPEVHFANSKADAEGLRTAYEGMRSSRFCLHAAGDTPSSCRLFDAIVNHCVPVIVSNKLELPYESTVDYSDFSIFLSHEDSLQEGHLLGLLKGMSKEEWIRRWRLLLEVARMFEFQTPSLRGDASSMVWREIRSRMPQVRREVNQHKRNVLARMQTLPSVAWK